MADQLSLRGGTTTEHATFTGANKEVTVDTTKKTLVVNDGATVGGHPLMRENASNSALALGSAGTPSLKFTGDTNTGIYSPGADQLAVATNGVGRLFVDSDGNIGIGGTTTTGWAQKQVVLDAGSGTSASYVLVNDTTGRAGTDGGLLTLSGSDLFLINREAANLIFRTSNAERLRITSAGLVGIGTSAPGSNLEVYASIDATGNNQNTNILTLTSFDSAGGYYYQNQGAGISFRSGQVTRAPQIMGAIYGANTSDQSTANGQLTFHTRSSDVVAERMRLTSTGLGIGTSSPSGNLHVYNPATTSADIYLENTDGYYNFKLNNQNFDILEGATSRLRILSGGNVGIGVTSPSSLLTAGSAYGGTPNINSAATFQSTTNTYITIGAGTSGDSGLLFADSGDNDVGVVGYNHGSNAMTFVANAAERVRIDSSGRLLVGTSSVSGLAAAKTVVVETTAAAVQRLIGNTAAQGSAQKITVVRYYPIISLGTKLIIPFVSQVSANTVTLCKVTGLRNQFNSNSPLPFEINFAVGHTNALFNLSSYGGQGNFASIAASGLNVEITFTTAYASGGIIVCIEYLTSSPLSSIDVPNIATN
jgi:hypothetical protein